MRTTNNIWSASWSRLSPQVRSLYPKLGVAPNAHLPRGATEKRLVDGFWVRVVGKQEALARSRFQRVLVTCPVCEREVPFGKLHQHMGRRDHRQERPAQAMDDACPRELGGHTPGY